MLSKKKYNQYDLRRLMKEQKLKLQAQSDIKTFKVGSPLARYPFKTFFYLITLDKLFSLIVFYLHIQ